MFRQYWELGYSVLPVIGKRTFINDWSRWCVERQPVELVDKWDLEYQLPKFGIAICAGPASNVDALDIDSNSEDILTLCPGSPLCRIGSKGRMPLFRHNPNLVKRKRDRNNLLPGKPTEGVQLLSTGNYFVIPPSIHPETLMPYRWIGSYTPEDFPASDLRQIPQDLLDSIVVYISRFPLSGRDGSIMGGIGGRNDKLTVVCYAKIKDTPWLSDEELAVELLTFDENHHSSPYFHDPGEMYYRKSATAYGRALLFVQGSRKRIERKEHT